MVSQEVLKYIKDSLAKGMPLEQIKKNLRASGWSDDDINEAVNVAGSKQTEKVPGVAPPKNIWIFIGIFAVVAVIVAIVLIFFFMNGGEEELGPTCIEAEGYVCSSGERCDGDYLDASDTSYCCSEICAPVCVEYWNCTEWSPCINNNQTQLCTDLNNCGTTYEKPPVSRDCGPPTGANCSAGDGCNLNCVNFGGDPDCTCVDLNNATSQNITLCNLTNQFCNGTILNSSDSGCCLGNCIDNSCAAGNECDLSCMTLGGDPDCGCGIQNGTICPSWRSFCNGTQYLHNSSGMCCSNWSNCLTPTCSIDGMCKPSGCPPHGDRDCTCEEQGGRFCEGENVTDACGDGEVLYAKDYTPRSWWYCCDHVCDYDGSQYEPF